VIEGEGWRLGYETAPESEESFCAIVRIKPSFFPLVPAVHFPMAMHLVARLLLP
jgi:hypothetical protein